MPPLATFLLTALLVIVFYLIIAERRHRSIRQTSYQLQSLINGMPDLMWVKDKQSRFLLVNSQFCKTFSLAREEIIGKTDFDLRVTPEQAQGYYEDDLKTQKSKKTLQKEEQIATPDGSFTWAETTKIPMFNRHNQVVGTAGVARDISKRKLAEQKITNLVYYDKLTNLPNRTSFVEDFNKLSIQNNGTIALILCDLNNFKIINDSFGYSFGDQVLIQIANQLKEFIDNKTIVARLSSDEFIIAHSYSQQENSLEKLQGKLLRLFEKPITLKDVKYNLSASFGIAVSPYDGSDYETLLKHADLALLQSQRNKHEPCVYFRQEFADELLYEMKLSNQLHQGISKQQFSIVYQPKVDSSTGNLIGLESLLRWQLEGHWVSPADFIPIAEKNGFIIELGSWVIENVLKQIKDWLERNIPVVPVSINVSALQLHESHFADNLLQQLEHYQTPGHLLEIELTEGVLMEDIEKMTALLKTIQNKGIAISIDDFGTGYSSLSYLPKLPINTLKIDRSFIHNIQHNFDNQKIVQTIVSLADNLNLSVIAEGIETEKELTETNNCGINNVQGYYYSRPLSLSELESRWLNDADSEVNR